MPSAKEIRNAGLADRAQAHLLPDPPPSPTSAIPSPPPIRPAEPAAAQETIEPVQSPWWQYLLYYLSVDVLILALLAIPIYLVMISAWTHAVTFGLFALGSITFAREKTQTGSRWCAKKILTRWWAVKLIVMVWWVCTLIIHLT